MGLKAYSLMEGQRYRVQTAHAVICGVFVDRETVDGEQFLLFVDVSHAKCEDLATARIRVRSIRDVQVDIGDE
jgi:hypothetical protein